MLIKRISIIGAGVMGSSTALVFAQRGYHVDLIDKSSSILTQAEQTITTNYRRQLFLAKQPSDRKQPHTSLDMNNIHFTTSLDCLRKTDYLIENTTEKWADKQALYPQMNRIASKDTIFAANTSTYPLSKFSNLIAHPERLIGLHFMNPVELKPMVEVIKSQQTSTATLETSLHLLASVNKEGIVVNDAPGFVSNRVLMLTINEAIQVLANKTANVQAIDQIFKGCLSHKMGPLETADLIGLDTILYSLESLQDQLNDDKFKPCPMLVEMVNLGLLGRKMGEGFYKYSTLQPQLSAKCKT